MAKELNIPNLETSVLVLHVKNGYEDRARHIEKTLGDLGINFVYILDGDMSEMDGNVVKKWFKGEMERISPASSCALKHFYAYIYIVENDLPGALILEDDIVLKKGFIEGVNSCLYEMRERNIKPGLISFEDSSLQFVAGSRRQKGVKIYPAERDRFAGCYYVPRQCAEAMIDYALKNKCDLPVDRWHTKLINDIDLPYYWTSPTYASQGSHNGAFASSISDGSVMRHSYQWLSWNLKSLYKRLLYRLR